MDAADDAAQVHVADGKARGRIAARIDRHEAVAHRLHVLGGQRDRVLDEPARHDVVDDRRHAFGSHEASRARSTASAGGRWAEVAISVRLVSALRIARREGLRRHAAEGEPDEMRLVDAKRVEKRDEVVREVVDRQGAVDDRGAAVAAGVVAQAAVARRERRAPARPTFRASCRGSSRRRRRAPRPGRSGRRTTLCRWPRSGAWLTSPRRDHRGRGPPRQGRDRSTGRRRRSQAQGRRRPRPAPAPGSAQRHPARARPVWRTASAARSTSRCASSRPRRGAEPGRGGIGEKQALRRVEVLPHALGMDDEPFGEKPRLAQRA